LGFSPCHGKTLTKFGPPRHRRWSADVLRDFEDESRSTPVTDGEACFVFRRRTSLLLKGSFKVHEFVVMPDHFHVLMSLDEKTSVERAVQLIKGNFSFRRKKELGLTGEVWQRGFSEVRVIDRASFLAHKEYIDQNPVKAGLAERAEDYPILLSLFAKEQKPQRLKV
jgi:REP element-mobilizing transposase RayT